MELNAYQIIVVKLLRMILRLVAAQVYLGQGVAVPYMQEYMEMNEECAEILGEKPKGK